MKKLKVKYLKSKSLVLSHLNERIDQIQDKNYINELSWKEFPYLPKVFFKIAYDDGHIFLKYFVEEEAFLTTKLSTNEFVHEDSCVEFFVSFDNGKSYYNLEFNFHGSCMMAYGLSRHDRELMNYNTIRKIRTKSSLKHQFSIKEDLDFIWELLIIIPLDVFIYHQPDYLKGKTLRANFYKCGDKLESKHYVAWNRIETDKPDFHQPKYFGELEFV